MRSEHLLKHSLAVFVIISSLFAASPAFCKSVHLRTEHMTTPLALDAERPAFSWQSNETTHNWMQLAYEIKVATDPALLSHGAPDVWNSGRVSASDSINIAYGGSPLRSQQRYFWSVSTWDKRGSQSTSDITWFETGLLKPSDWKGEWIRRSDPEADQEMSAVRWIWIANTSFEHMPGRMAAEFHYKLHLDTEPKRATMHVIARAAFVASVNGKITGEHHGWNSFDYEEIRTALKFGQGALGDNNISIQVTAPDDDAQADDVFAGLAATIRLVGQDGIERHLVSDTSWTAGPKDGVMRQAAVVGTLSTPFFGKSNTDATRNPSRVSTDVALLRKDFTVAGDIRSARLTITALGAYRAYLNGKPVASKNILDPGFTDFSKRVLYQTYDVTSVLTRGENAIGVELAGGWHGSPLLWLGTRSFDGPDALRAQLDISFEDGSHQVIATDGKWKTATAPTLSAEIYGGEAYDARIERVNWNAPGFVDSSWSDVVLVSVSDSVKLTSQPDLSIARNEVLHPIAISEATAAHPVIFDMGQNMVGSVALHLRGPRGAVVRLRYAERLNPDGSIYTENLRNATSTDTYTLSGKGDETYSPAFTFHGFRYVEVSGLPLPPATATLEGLVYNSLPESPTISFSSSSELLNRMSQLGFWGQRGNFFSIPTDCPQRDERMGWMGDAGVFWRTGAYNFDIASFTQKFMMDIDDAQTASGSFTDIAPDLLHRPEGAPGWGDAGILVPYAAWQQYGDTALLERSWPQMERFMEFIHEANPDYLRRNHLGANYADWLAPDERTPKDLIATAYWALIARDMQEMAIALRRQDDAIKYQALYEHIAAAYRAAYVHADGSIDGGTQTAYVVTLYTGIAPQQQRSMMTNLLVKDIEAHQYHLTTGFLGTPFLMFVLDDNHRADVAYRLLLQDTYPSWGYMVRKDATTWWERWNGDTGDPRMNSYNHYAFGSVMAWVFRRVSGIDTDASGAGFHHLVIAPQIDDALPRVSTAYGSEYGKVITSWDRAKHRFEVILPANTTATVKLPNGKTDAIGSGEHSYLIQ